MNIELKVRETIAKNLGISIEKVTPEKRFIDDLGADSLDVVEIVISLEDEFKILINEDDAELITTVESAIEYVTKLVNNQ
jgi:acyl carrier protein